MIDYISLLKIVWKDFKSILYVFIPRDYVLVFINNAVENNSKTCVAFLLLSD